MHHIHSIRAAAGPVRASGATPSRRPAPRPHAGRLLRLGGLLLAAYLWPVTLLAGGAIPTSATLTSSANPAAYGQFVLYSARVTASDGSIPAGSITFHDGASAVLTIDLDAGGQGIMGTNLPAGTHALTVSYAGSATHAPSTSEVLNQVVERPASVTAVNSSLNPSVAGQAVTLTASVVSSGFNSPTPTGAVTFLDGDLPLGSANLDAAARASLTTTALGAGSHAITAHYAGDASNAGSTSAVLDQVVQAATIEVAVTVSTDPPPACGAVSDLDVVAGTQVNYCFTVTNHTAETLRYHTLGSDQYSPEGLTPGDPFARVLFELEVAPGASARYNKVVTAGATRLASFTWTAFAAQPAYAVDDAAPLDVVDLGTAGTPISGNGLVPLPFAFTLYGRSFAGGQVDALCVYNNGAVQFVADPGLCGGAFPLFGGDTWFPPPPDANDSLLPYWDALGSAGQVRQATVGQAPDRRFVVEWRQKNHAWEEDLGLGCGAAPADCGITFQLILDEADGAISFSYPDVGFDTEGGDVLLIDRGGSAGIALIDTDRTLRQEYSVEQQRLTDGQTIRWTRRYAPYLASAQTRVGTGLPRIVATPATIDVAAVEGEVLIRSLGIGNAGNLALEWTLDRVPAAAHLPPGPRYVAPVGDPAGTALGVPPAAAGRAGAWRLPDAQPWLPASVFEVPAYGVKSEPLQFIELVGLDARHPGAFVRVGVTHETLAGDFVGNDFSKEFVITQCTAVADECFDSIDTATGQLTEIAVSTPPPGQHWTGMAWDCSSGTLFASSSTCGDSPADRRSFLRRFDPVTGLNAPVAEILTGAEVCIVDVAVAPNGQMYGLDIHHDALVAIDKVTGAAQPIGSVGFDANYQQSMDFDDATGVLYLAGYTDSSPALVAMYTVDLATGLATRLGRFDYAYSFMNLAALAIASPGGVCTQADEVPWLFYDVVSGRTEPGQQSSARVVFDATGLATGTYRANLCVGSNDPARPLLDVPVSLRVGTDAVFADGFEAR